MPTPLFKRTPACQAQVPEAGLSVAIGSDPAERGPQRQTGVSLVRGPARQTNIKFLYFLILACGTAPYLMSVAAFAAPNQVPASPPGPSVNNPIPDGTIAKAGAALRDVTRLQQKYQSQFEAASQAQKQELMQQVGAEAMKAIRSHDLSVQEYATIARSAQTDAQVKQRLLNAASQE